MPKLECIAAALTFTARLVVTGAQHELREPVGETLLADTTRTVKKNAGWQRSTFDALLQRLPDRVMAENGYQGHV
jgi:hypothetical protein